MRLKINSENSTAYFTKGGVVVFESNTLEGALMKLREVKHEKDSNETIEDIIKLLSSRTLPSRYHGGLTALFLIHDLFPEFLMLYATDKFNDELVKVVSKETELGVKCCIMTLCPEYSDQWMQASEYFYYQEDIKIFLERMYEMEMICKKTYQRCSFEIENYELDTKEN